MNDTGESTDRVSADFFAGADRELLKKLRETAEFLIPLNKKLAEKITAAADKAQKDFSDGKPEASLKTLHSLFYGPSGIDSVFVSHIVKREKLEYLKNDLRSVFPKSMDLIKDKGDHVKTMSQWIEQCHRGAKDKGFWDKDRNVGEMLMLIVSELGEAVEAHRKGQHGLLKKDTFEDELADTVIRLFDLCGGLGIDLEKQVEWKLEFNKSRAERHGAKY